MSTPIYAVGDIHGQLAELKRVLSLIETDGGQDAEIVFVGDYTDRGADSKAVLDLLIEGQEAGRNWHFLLGNHDDMFRMFFESPPRHEPHLPTALYWLHPRLGGDTTLASYGVVSEDTKRLSVTHAETLAAVPQRHVEFLHSLKPSHTHGDLFFCHAGIRPGVSLQAQTVHDLIWIRQEFHSHTAPHPKLIIHGHTPVDAATHYGNRVNIDSGAGYGRDLTAVVCIDNQIFQVCETGRKALTPLKNP